MKRRGEDERRKLHSLACTCSQEREESEENFPPRDGNISVVRVRALEENRKEESERGEKEERERKRSEEGETRERSWKEGERRRERGRERKDEERDREKEIISEKEREERERNNFVSFLYI